LKAIVSENLAAEDSNSPQETVLGMEVEIPYIPASQRKVTQVVDDSIVVVGQARQKKRKRAKITPGGIEPSVSAEASKLKEAGERGVVANNESTSNEEPFDFSAVPNILDDNPNLEDTKKKRKQKKQKTSRWFRSDIAISPVLM
jgi:exosome complex exonuclease RRP6